MIIVYPLENLIMGDGDTQEWDQQRPAYSGTVILYLVCRYIYCVDSTVSGPRLNT